MKINWLSIKFISHSLENSIYVCMHEQTLEKWGHCRFWCARQKYICFTICIPYLCLIFRRLFLDSPQFVNGFPNGLLYCTWNTIKRTHIYVTYFFAFPNFVSAQKLFRSLPTNLSSITSLMRWLIAVHYDALNGKLCSDLFGCDVCRLFLTIWRQYIIFCPILSHFGVIFLS